MSANEELYGVCYRTGAPDVTDYDEAITALRNAREALLSGDSFGCRICEDGGHGANMCHHNPLLLARKWAAATGVWQCWHCGFVATNAEEAQEHFGLHEAELPRCQIDRRIAERFRDALVDIRERESDGPTWARMRAATALEVEP